MLDRLRQPPCCVTAPSDEIRVTVVFVLRKLQLAGRGLASPMRIKPPWATPRSVVCAVVITAMSGAVATAAGVGQTGRRTTDRQADLIAALLDRQMGDVADAICARQLAEVEAGSEAAARWAIRLSSVRTATMLSQEELSAEVIQQATQPPSRLLASYPNHQRQLWLRTQLALVDLAVAQHAAVRLAVAGDRPELRASALQQVADALRQLKAIEEEVSRAIPVAESTSDAPTALADELVALRQTVGRERIDALLLRSRLYPDASADAVAAATSAEAASDALLAQLPQDAQIRPEIVRLKAEAILRAGDAARAGGVLASVQQDDRWPSAASAALSVRIALARGEADAALDLLQAFYGADPAAAAPSVEMDLARLAFLVHTARQQPEAERDAAMRAVADWLEVMERRGGVYARRRGEAETLAAVRMEPVGGDARLLAAEAADQLRRGNAVRGGEMLAQAAAVADRPDEALLYAAQAAAALAATNEHGRAAAILVQVSQRHAEHRSAAATHLQAAWLLTEAIKSGQQVDAESLEAVLTETMQRWPGSQQHRLAAQWLIRMLESTGQFRRAARLIAPPEVGDWTPEALGTAGRLWRRAARSAGNGEAVGSEEVVVEQVVDEALAVMRGALDAPDAAGVEAAEQLVWTAAVMASPDRLRADSWPLDRIAEASPAWFYARLLPFRRDRLRPDTLPWKAVLEFTAEESDDVVRRLVRDGLADPQDRDRNGRAILRLIDALDAVGGDRAVDEQQRARALCWTGQWQQARSLLQQAIDASPADAGPLRTAAEVLGQCPAAAAQREAIALWNRVAAGLPQGTPAWHEAKLAAADLLIAVGDPQQARRLVRYVLLTQPPEDAAMLARYQTLAK